MRVKLDLSQFLEDEQKFSVLKVNPSEIKTVRDVLLKINNLFQIPVGIEVGDDPSKKPTLGLFEDENFYIHPNETATVLQDTGVLKLKALPKQGGRKKKKSKKDHSEDDITSYEDEKRKSKKGRFVEDLDQNTSTRDENRERRLVRSTEDLISIENDYEDEVEKRTTFKRKRAKILESEGYEIPVQKKSRNRTSEEFSEDEDSKRQRAKPQRTKLDLTSDEEPQSRKKKKGRVREVEAEDDLTSDEEPQSRKKKKGRVREVEAEYVDEVVEVCVPKKKKSKIDEDIYVEEKHKTGDFIKKSGWDVINEEEFYEMKAQAERRKIKEDKSSQEKVVSTSSVINLDTEEALDSDSSSSIESTKKYQTGSKLGPKHFAADSVTDPWVVENPVKKKRKRKHNKTKRHEQTQPVRAEPYVESKANYCWPGSAQPIHKSSFSKKHVYFNSDDEEARNKETLPRDIEIVETTSPDTLREEKVHRRNVIGQVTGRTRKINPDHCARERIVPVDLEAEDQVSSPQNSLRDRLPNSNIKPSTKNRNESDEFDMLRNICEYKTITVCKVDGKKEKPKYNMEASPGPSPTSSRLDPPSPVFIHQKPTKEATQTFHKILKMQNGPTTLIENPRKVVHLDDTDLNTRRESPGYAQENGKSVGFPESRKAFVEQGTPSRSSSILQNSKQNSPRKITTMRTEERSEIVTTKVLSGNREAMQRAPQSLEDFDNSESRSPAQGSTQFRNLVESLAPTNQLESEVVDLDSEEEIEIPTARSTEGKTRSSETVTSSKKEVKESSVKDSSKAASSFTENQNEMKENSAASGLMQEKGKSQQQDFDNLFDLAFAVEGEEEEDEIDKNKDEVRVEEFEKTGEHIPERLDFENVMNSRLKNCLEKITDEQEHTENTSKVSERAMDPKRLENMVVDKKTDDTQSTKTQAEPSTSQGTRSSITEVVMGKNKEIPTTTEKNTNINEGELNEEWLKNCPIMQDLPKIGQFIAVKRMIVEDAYCPLYSDYMKAEVIEVEGTKVYLRFIDNNKKKSNSERSVEEVDLTFEEEEEEDEDEDEETVEELDWRDLDEPRLIK